MVRSDRPFVFASALTASPRASPTNALLALARSLTALPCELAAAAVAMPSPNTTETANTIGFVARCICIEPPCEEVPQTYNAAWRRWRYFRNVQEIEGRAVSTSLRYGIASEQGT